MSVQREQKHTHVVSFSLGLSRRPASRLAFPLFSHTMSDDDTCPKPALEEACKKHCVKYLVAYEVRG
jgi:hypothetical protein